MLAGVEHPVAAAAQEPPRSLTVLAIHDEASMLEHIRALLRSDPRVGDVRTASDAAAALRVIEGDAVDAVFLDIDLRGCDGLRLARHILDHRDPPAVVFITARDDAAVGAFAVGALDYLLTPLTADRLAEALRRVSTSRTAREPTLSDAIAVELGGVTRWVSVADVRWAQAQGDYTRLHTADGSHLVRMPISVLEERWRDFGFMRIHRSHLVSASHVAELRVEGGGAYVVRVADLTLRVSRRYAPSLKERLKRRPSRD